MALAEVWPGLQRTYHQARSGSDAPDIDAPTCPAWIEVKRQEAINVFEAHAQAERAMHDAWEKAPRAAYRPVVVAVKRNRTKWLVVMTPGDLARLMGR